MSERTYKLMEHGVQRSDGTHIPATTGNRHWREYLKWLDAGNTPDPEFTPEEEAQKAVADEVNQLKDDLRKAQVWQFRLTLELFKLLKQGTTIKNSDVDPDILAKAGQWATKLNRLKEIDE